eukprot:gene10813-4995_t
MPEYGCSSAYACPEYPGALSRSRGHPSNSAAPGCYDSVLRARVQGALRVLRPASGVRSQTYECPSHGCIPRYALPSVPSAASRCPIRVMSGKRPGCYPRVLRAEYTVLESRVLSPPEYGVARVHRLEPGAIRVRGGHASPWHEYRAISGVLRARVTGLSPSTACTRPGSSPV